MTGTRRRNETAESAKAHRRYEEERRKRVRADGIGQYIEPVGALAQTVEDPYTAPLDREPLTDDVKVLLIGGGFGNLLMAAQLRQAGFTDVEDIRVIDKAGDFGGTWYWNRYPGAMCDIESYIYLPMLEELDYMPRTRYAHAPEIFAHARRMARHLDLYPAACLQTAVTEIEWDASANRWIVSTDRGDRMRAQFVIMASGPLNRPKLPGIPGIETFGGKMFHTSRWDFEYTGGDTYGNLSRLGDKRVGIIGTGATGIQCIPHLGESADALFVFQRTPAAVDLRNNSATDPEWFGSLPPGWQRARQENFTRIIDGTEEELDLVNDGWTAVFRNLSSTVGGKDRNQLSRRERSELASDADMATMNAIRRRIDEVVDDPEVAELLKPWFGRWCKRPCFHDEYLPTFNRHNVTLVDTDGRGVERITATGAVVAGREYPLDCLVFATGFETGTDYTRRAQFEIIGQDGQRLSDKWSDGYRTLYGLQTNGFPNCFFLGSGQTGVSPNYTHMVGEQVAAVAALMRHALDEAAEVVQPAAEAEEAWVAEMNRLSGRGASYYEKCTPGFLTSEGNFEAPTGLLAASYGGGPSAFFDILRSWRTERAFDGELFQSQVPKGTGRA